MTITQYLPQWLRSRLQKPIPQKPTTANKKDRQVLATMPKPERPPIRMQDDDSPAGHRIQWRL
jgi:hypothetical protein